MYDMYPWDTQDSAAKDAVSQEAVTQGAVTQDRATQAVQVALDRRDNGGDADK